MVKNIFSFISKEISGIHEAAYLLAFFTFLSQILSLIRDKLLAFKFGANVSLDIYYAAFRLPDLIFVSIGSIVSISVLLPLITEAYENKDKGKKFIDSIFTVFFLSLTFVCLLAFVFSPNILRILIPGFVDNTVAFDELIDVTRILLLSPMFLGISNFLSNITQMHRRFMVYAISPLVYNLGIILGLIFLNPIFGLKGLALGVVIGAFLHMAIQIPFVLSCNVFPKIKFNIDFGVIKKVILISLPRTLTLSSGQLALFFLISIASFVNDGAISIFNLALNLQSVPLTIVGVSYSSAIFPTLSKFFVNDEKSKFIDKIVDSARHIIFWSVPITVLFIVLRAQIVRTIYGAGAFDWSDTRLTAATLALFIISVTGQSLILLFVRASYARGKTFIPLIINVSSSIMIAVLGYIFTKIFYTSKVFVYFLEDLFKVHDDTREIILVLALAYSIGTILNLIIYWSISEYEYRGFSKRVIPSFFQSFAGSVIMGYVTFVSLRFFNQFFPLTKFWGVFLQGFCSGIVGIFALIIILRILRNKEILEVWETLHHKLWKAKVVIPEQENL